MMRHRLAADAVLEPLEPWRAAELAAFVETHRAYLDPWVPPGHRIFAIHLEVWSLIAAEWRRAHAAEGEHTAPERLAMMHAHRDAVRAQLAELTLALETIEFKIAAYGGELAPDPPRSRTRPTPAG